MKFEELIILEAKKHKKKKKRRNYGYYWPHFFGYGINTDNQSSPPEKGGNEGDSNGSDGGGE